MSKRKNEQKDQLCKQNMTTESSVKEDKTAGMVQLAPCASCAVGISDMNKKWFIIQVNNNTEKSSSERLSELGYETYLPVQEVTSVWKDGRKKVRQRILIPNMVFIRLSEQERKDVLSFPFVKRFMVNRAGSLNSFNRHPIATIPDEQMNQLKFMLGQSESSVSIESNQLVLGSRIRIVRGLLRGLEGELLQSSIGKSYIMVSLDCLGYAKLEVSLSDINLLNN